jgi:antitoxin component YwqK of YwqJK toxin-antitoxin module
MQNKTPKNEQGNRHGYWKIYWDNGQLSHKGSYINGTRFGCHEDYYYDGRLYYKGNYINDDRHGYYEDDWGHKMIKRYYAR